MRIQHNIMAMNAYRNYNNNTKALSGNLEKLSSGYKINRAGDDAAGLAISEKMRAQITGLDAAKKNVKDGISLVKTAEGAMQEVQDMLNRMDYLATQSANGTYDNEVDRANLQKEVEALKSEINRIADSANFNGIKLLDGSLAKADAIAAGTSTKTTDIDGMDRILSTVADKSDVDHVVAGNKTILDSVPDGTPTKGKFKIDFTTMEFNVQGTASGGTASTTTGIITVNIGGVTFTSATASTASAADGIAMSAAGSTVSATDVAASVSNGIKKEFGSEAKVTINGVEWEVTDNGDGTLSFEQTELPETSAQAKTNFDVSVSFSDSNGGGDFSITLPEESTGGAATGALTPVHSVKVGTETETKAVAKEDAHKANTVFKITADDIKDGTKIAIGTKAYVLKIGGDDSTLKDYNDGDTKDGCTVIDLGHNTDLNNALAAISGKAGGTVNLKIWDSANKTAQNVSFQIGVSDGSQGFPTGLTLVRVDAVNKNGTGGAKLGFDSLEKLAQNFKMQVNETTKTEAKAATDGLTLQIGDTADSFNQMKVVIGDLHTTGMGIDGIDISTQKGAQDAVQVVRDAINYVSSIRGDLGAVQNRLEHTGNNLSVMQENIQDAESTIRDTDVADEMMKYVKNNILVQSAQAMLAQANQVPQGVLQLLG